MLLVGRSRKMPVVVDDQIAVRLMMPLSLSYDHRLVDGAAAARFLNDVINYLDGDSASGVTYGYGITSLISDKSRVIKGGSWNDRPYWLSPGTRRFMEEDQAASTVGFRCAQTYLGPPEGPGFKEGNIFGTRKQNSRKGKKK